MRQTSFRSALFELFSSMRFAVSLLTIIAIASVVGTVLKQNEPYPNYMAEFGNFWFIPFETLGLFDVYHAGWFLLILAFLVLSTSLCIWRNLPGMMKDIKGYRDKASLTSLRLMSHHSALPAADGQQAAALRQLLTRNGFRFKERQDDDGVLLAGKRGSWQKLGYFFAHAAIVVICIGGLLDGNLPLKLAELAGRIVPETRDIPQSQVPASARLDAGNLSYRGSVTIPESGSANVVFLNVGKGYLVQELPFSVRLKKFYIEHYPTGQPKLFASDIEVTDKASGKVQTATVKVNHPLVIDGVAIYQSSFGDGGSRLELQRWPLLGKNDQSTALQAVSQSQQKIRFGNRDYALEWGDFRAFNIEALEQPAQGPLLADKLTAAQNVKAAKHTQNFGPSIQYKLRDDAGQAREYLTYLAPIESNGAWYQMAGMRSDVGAPFQFIRLPLDGDNSLASFMRLKAVLLDAQAWPEIAQRTAAKAESEGAISAATRAQFTQSMRWVLDRYAQGGFAAVQGFLEQNVPKDKREVVGQTYVKLLQGATLEAWALAQQRAGRAVETMNPQRYRLLMDSLVAISSSFDYGMPDFLQLTGFSEVKASGLQLTRSPGKNVVYLGSLLLVLGIFCMFYIREQRVWLYLAPSNSLLAMSCNRRTSDFDQDYATLLAAVIAELGPVSPAAPTGEQS